MKCLKKLYLFFKRKFEKRLITQPPPFNRNLVRNYPIKTKYNRRY